MNIEKTTAYLMDLVDDYRDTDKKCGSFATAKARAVLINGLREVLQCKACPVTLDGYSPSNEAVQIQEPGQSTKEQQAKAWRAVWEVLQEVKPGFDDCYPLSGQEAAIKAIRELAAVQQGYMPAQAVVQIQEPERNKPSMSMHVSVEDYQRALADWEAEQFQLAAVQQGVQQIKANCYSDNDGDSWRDCPDDCDFVEGLKVGDTFELQASVRSWSETFRVTKAPDDGNDDYEVELVSSDAPFATNPTQQWLDALTQAARDVIAERARQINAKGYEPDADDGYEHGELAFAAATYAVLATNAQKHTTEHLWPWSLDSLKVGEPRRMLVKAGALIQAAIEREDRTLAAKAKQGGQANG